MGIKKNAATSGKKEYWYAGKACVNKTASSDETLQNPVNPQRSKLLSACALSLRVFEGFELLGFLVKVVEA